MARVRFHPFGTMRSLFGKAQVEVDVSEGCTVRDLINLLAAEYHPNIRRDLIDPGTGGFRQGVHIFIDEMDIQQAEALETQLRNGQDVVVLRGDMAGGSRPC